MDEPKKAISTIGYGNRSVEELVRLLKQHSVECVVDVRTSPYSKFKPEFNRESFETQVSANAIRYVFAGNELGGRPDAPECYVDGKVDYDRVRELDSYSAGIRRLQRAYSTGLQIALMCSELRPEDCHRSKLIGVTLVELGIPVMHIDEECVLRSQEEVIARLTGGQLDLFGDPSFTSRKRYGDEK